MINWLVYHQVSKPLHNSVLPYNNSICLESSTTKISMAGAIVSPVEFNIPQSTQLSTGLIKFTCMYVNAYTVYIFFFILLC